VFLYYECVELTFVRFASDLFHASHRAPAAADIVAAAAACMLPAVDWIRCPHCRTETMCGSAGALKINFALVDLLHYDDAGLVSPAGAAAAGGAAAAHGGTHCGNCGMNFVFFREYVVVCTS